MLCYYTFLSSSTVVPELPPQVSRLPASFSPGDWLHLNCTSGRSNPGARLTWIVNGKEAGDEMLRKFPSVDHGGGFKTSILGLQFWLRRGHFAQVNYDSLKNRTTLYFTRSLCQITGRQAPRQMSGAHRRRLLQRVPPPRRREGARGTSQQQGGGEIEALIIGTQINHMIIIHILRKFLKGGRLRTRGHGRGRLRPCDARHRVGAETFHQLKHSNFELRPPAVAETVFSFVTTLLCFKLQRYLTPF